MEQFQLKAQFTEEFFNEFQFDAEFRSIFESMTRGLTPYEAIEHLCKSKKELLQSLQKAIENAPTKITTERFERLKKQCKRSDVIGVVCKSCGSDDLSIYIEDYYCRDCHKHHDI
jgi:predicted RNase H-like HicB family nuclease